VRYPLKRNTVDDFEEFSRIIGNYYNYHFTNCVSCGGSLPASEAIGRAKELLEQQYRRHGGDIVTAFNDSRDGTNGGLRVVLDMIAEGLKAESVERHIRDAFDRWVLPNSWELKVEIIRQFIRTYGGFLSSSIRTDQPERFAQQYQELIRSYSAALQKTSSIFRRL
jgi:hypothetical protein